VDLKNLTIVAVDENQMILKVLNDFLKEFGHQVYTYCSFEELMDKHPPARPADIIFICPNHSAEHSRAIVNQTHQLHPQADIVIMRDNHGLLSFEDAISNNVFAYLSKPFRLGEVELMVRRITEKRDQLVN
jgi:DNA-binding NtrC family response regulator